MRKARGLMQENLAYKAGIDRSYIGGVVVAFGQCRLVQRGVGLLAILVNVEHLV